MSTVEASWCPPAGFTDPRVVPVLKPHQVSRSVQKQASTILEAACAEAGHPIESVWDDVKHAYRHWPWVPYEVLNRARIISLDALGIEWKWIDEAEGRDMTTEKGADNDIG